MGKMLQAYAFSFWLLLDIIILCYVNVSINLHNIFVHP